ncbi:hypothetical protein OG607_01570 [Streptomyces sp. NBC_01537]|uniref:hypothetical protein n=1 Tax=Streptomyces sp. NBC_01537 TaxID=2903896 RepID=UPI003866C68E
MSDDVREGGSRAREPLRTSADERLTDPRFLVTVDPEKVLMLLGEASSPAARRAAAVYRATFRRHWDRNAGVRRQLLAVNAARYGDSELAARITAASVTGEPTAQWGVQWATGSELGTHRSGEPD